MICFGHAFLRTIGMSDDSINEIYVTGDFGGIATSPLFSFGGGGNRGRDRTALALGDEPRHLVLVGMSDRYGEGAKLATVSELCLHENQLSARSPTHPESVVIAVYLSTCTHPAAGAIRELVIAAGSAT